MRLLEPIKVGKIELKNRVMFPPMTTGYEGRDGTIVEQSFNFYKRLAEGGVSYIVLGDVAPVNTISPNCCASPCAICFNRSKEYPIVYILS